MGMEVVGLAPTGEQGRLFVNNVYWWRPLAEFLQSEFPDLTAGCADWDTNAGAGLDGGAAILLGEAVGRAVASGRVAAYEAQRAERLSALPRPECDLCEGRGYRTDKLGVFYGLDKPRDPVTGKGGCNKCEGTGTVEPLEREYGFDTQNVADFGAFLRASGGFRIE
ncbi:hypothetical protein ABZ464_42635 [Streptomyces sp. NPDC005820]|uniref:hypothetical protein n=1 Tax=Streptomyces sp. NPDC005820 TaxID=3157069 RepID=UPI00340753EF